MSTPIIEVRGLSKHYELGRWSFRTLQEDIRRLFGASSGYEKIGVQRRFWALEDVSFDVAKGEVLGIIGHNGAGKSTLCKLLSRITEPSVGEAILRGRTASLLEVGTGFHPDLTGRENIFLNGTILGMRRAEIRAQFDEIVAFAEVEKFLDTPARRYSSGMQVRLAFAVAAHLRAEILIADEVLAVGDLEFQKKCIGKMKSVAEKEGRTVLFVSHNLGAVQGLCGRAILIDRGRLAFDGRPEETIRHYVKARSEGSARVDLPPPEGPAGLRAIEVVPEDPEFGIDLPGESPFRLRMVSEFSEPLRGPRLDLSIVNHLGQRVLTLRSPDLAGEGGGDLAAGRYEHEVEIPGNLLAPGEYTVDAALHQPPAPPIDQHRHALSFRILPTSPLAQLLGKDAGLILGDYPWKERAVAA